MDDTYVDPLIEATKVGHLGELPPGSPDRATLGQAHQLANYAMTPVPVKHQPDRSKVGGEGEPDPERDPLEGIPLAGGWYAFPDGTKVQGREAALAHLQANPPA